MKLEIGGDIETYWKSLAIPVASPLQTSFPNLRHRSTLISSAHTSPSVHSNYGASTSAPALTISSLQGQYVRVTVQVTKDYQPVIFSDWLLPATDFDLCVCDVTLAQFEKLARRLGQGVECLTGVPDTWPALLSRVMISLAQFFTVSRYLKHYAVNSLIQRQVLPQELGISIDLAYPAKHVSETQLSSNQLNLNTFIDSVLRTIYQVSAPSEVLTKRRRVVFTSFSPDVCAILNWKQPNCERFPCSCQPPVTSSS